MNRLTEENPNWLGEEFWYSAEEPDMENIDKVYLKLREYENTGLQPEEIEKIRCRRVLTLDSSDISKADCEKLCEQIKEQNKIMLADVLITPMKLNDNWILAKDRMPEEADLYLTTDNDGDIGITLYLIDNGGMGWNVASKREYIVAWMPLPEPYETTI